MTVPSIAPDRAEAGQAIYTRPVLAVYDLLVLGHLDAGV